MNMKRTGSVLALLGALALTGAPADVSACGGCFAGPTTVQVVTDHRMVLAVSPTQTTLWDQFQYSGNPAEFSWILPIRYTDRTEVAQADDGFMRMADSLTAPIVVPPSRPFCFRGPSAASDGSFADAAASTDAGVVVLRQEVVGPYAVSIIRGTDPMAMRNWLTANGYVVTPAVSPVIDYYTSLNMDYVALRLRPGEGINRMTPIRVTVEGAMPSLPLRMISAGIADRVGLSLVVVSASRYEAANFPNGEIRESELTWDFASPGSPATDFLNAFSALNRANGERLWLTESATTQRRDAWEATAPSFRGTTASGGAGDAFAPRDGGAAPPPPPVDAGGGSTDAGASADVPPRDVPSDPPADGGTGTDPLNDVRVAFTGLGESAVVTRFRANMPGTMLTADLQLRASTAGERSRTYNYGRLLNDPGLTCNGTTGPIGDDAGLGAGGSAGGGGASCAVTPTRATRQEGVFLALAGAAMAAVGYRARRRRH